MTVALIVVAIIALLLVIYRDIIRDYYYRPRLVVTFSLKEPVSRITSVGWPLGTSHPTQWKSAFWPRLRVLNSGRSVARQCEAIIAEVRNPDGTLNKQYDPLKLRWAIAPIHKGLEPLDIARHRQVDLNLFTTIDGESNAPIATFPDPVGVPLFFEPGDYWLKIVIYGGNFSPVERGYAVHWPGKDYKRVEMQEMNRVPSSIAKWPWTIGDY